MSGRKPTRKREIMRARSKIFLLSISTSRRLIFKGPFNVSENQIPIQGFLFEFETPRRHSRQFSCFRLCYLDENEKK